MVFGFFEGSVSIVLNKMNFAFGEDIEGSVSLKLKNEKKARQMAVLILAEREYKTYRNGSYSSETRTLFTNSWQLDGEKAYLPPGADYQFKIQLPQKSVLPQEPQFSGALGTVVDVVKAVSGGPSPIKWFVIAKLDIPGGIDISKRAQISVQ